MTAKVLGVSESTLSRWVDDEGLTAYLINGRYRFNRVDLLEWASHRKLPAAALFASTETAAAVDLASLLEGNIHYQVPGADRAAAMAAVAERLPLPNARDKALAARMLEAREAMGSTAIGDGIAVPHARSPLVFAVDRPAVALCFLKVPVPFGAGDGTPVHTVFALVTPTIRVHLALLAKVSLALHDPALRELLRERADAPRILARLRELA
ncbi:MAG: PTS sugar transporter subunit IIA [Elusimicrobia bacterium]|nr:PTS sugar transporter subunit IIA [Elusimicrobiota bacterium]